MKVSISVLFPVKEMLRVVCLDWNILAVPFRYLGSPMTIIYTCCRKLVFILSLRRPLWHLFQREMGMLALQTSVGYLWTKSLSTLFKVSRCTFGKFVKVASPLVISDWQLPSREAYDKYLCLLKDRTWDLDFTPSGYKTASKCVPFVWNMTHFHLDIRWLREMDSVGSEHIKLM